MRFAHDLGLQRRSRAAQSETRSRDRSAKGAARALLSGNWLQSQRQPWALGSRGHRGRPRHDRGSIRGRDDGPAPRCGGFVPWRDAHVWTWGGNRASRDDEDHLTYLSGLRRVLKASNGLAGRSPRSVRAACPPNRCRFFVFSSLGPAAAGVTDAASGCGSRCPRPHCADPAGRERARGGGDGHAQAYADAARGHPRRATGSGIGSAGGHGSASGGGSTRDPVLRGR